MSRLKYHAIWIVVMVALVATANIFLQIGADGTTENWVCTGSAIKCMAPSTVTPGARLAGSVGTILMAVAMVCVWPWLYYRPKPQRVS